MASLGRRLYRSSIFVDQNRHLSGCVFSICASAVRLTHLCWAPVQISYTNQVVNRGCKSELPIDAITTAKFRLANGTDRFHPTVAFFDSLTQSLADFIAGMPRRPIINCARTIGLNVARYMRSYLKLSERFNKISRVVRFVRRECRSMTARNRFGHFESSFALGVAGSRRHTRVDDQSVSVLGHQVTKIAQFRFLTAAFAVHSRSTIGRRPEYIIFAALPVKIDIRVSRSAATRRLRLVGFWNKTLLAGPSLDHRSVNGKMLVAKQVGCASLAENLFEKRLCNVALQQPIAILREDRDIPDGIIHVQIAKPAKKHIVVQLLHELPLAANRIHHLQDQSTQQMFWWNRWAPAIRIKLVKLAGKIYKHCLNHRLDRPQRVINRNTILRRNVAPHSNFSRFLSAHERSITA
jgi:hypothetical protein